MSNDQEYYDTYITHLKDQIRDLRALINRLSNEQQFFIRELKATEKAGYKNFRNIMRSINDE